MNIILTACTILYTEVEGKTITLFVGRENGNLAFPGGHIDEGESPLTGALRELKEETGINLDNLKMFKVINRHNPWQYHFFFYAHVDSKVLHSAKAKDDAKFVRLIENPLALPKKDFAFNNQRHWKDFKHLVLDL